MILEVPGAAGPASAGARWTVGGATPDLNDLPTVASSTRNNRLKRLLELKAPGNHRPQRKRMLQEAADSLLDNGRRGKAMTRRRQQAPAQVAGRHDQGQGRPFPSEPAG